jgi:hypothetical protein
MEAVMCTAYAQLALALMRSALANANHSGVVEDAT